MPASAPRERICAKAVGARGAFENAEIDDGPDQAEDRDKQDQHPPAGLVAIMKPLDVQHDAGDQQQNAENERDQAVTSEQPVQNEPGAEQDDDADPPALPLDAPFRRREEIGEIQIAHMAPL